MPNFEDQTVRFAPGSSPYKTTHNPSGTKLLIFDGDKAPAEYDLRSFGKNIITFGRNPENNDIVLTSKIASRQHGYFELRNGRIFVYDQNSMNGLILNSTYIQSAAFGGGDNSYKNINTDWNGSSGDIWVRRTFELSNVDPNSSYSVI